MRYIFLQILTGHKDDAEFALATCPTEPFVLSGGWNLVLVFFFSFSSLDSLTKSLIKQCTHFSHIITMVV